MIERSLEQRSASVGGFGRRVRLPTQHYVRFKVKRRPDWKTKLIAPIVAIALLGTLAIAQSVNHCELAGTTQKTGSVHDAGRDYTYEFARDMKTVKVTDTLGSKSRSEYFKLRYWKRSGKWTYSAGSMTVTVCDPKNPGFVSPKGNGWSRSGIPFY